MQNGKLRERIVILLEDLSDDSREYDDVVDEISDILNEIENAFNDIVSDLDDISIDNLDVICSARDKAEEAAKWLY